MYLLKKWYKRGFDYFLGGVRHKDGHEHYPADMLHAKKRVGTWEQNQEIGKKLKGGYTTGLFTAASEKMAHCTPSRYAEEAIFPIPLLRYPTRRHSNRYIRIPERLWR